MSLEQNLNQQSPSAEIGFEEKPEQAEQPKEILEKSLEIPNDPEAVLAYEKVNQEIDNNINTKEQELKDLSGRISEIYKNLGIETSNTQQESIPSLLQLQNELKELSLKKIEGSANYPGDWTLLLQERMLDPVTKEKFIKARESAMIEMKTGEPEILDKPKQFSQHYQEQINKYDKNVAHIFNETQIGEASEFGKTPDRLGMGNIGEQGAVFNNASHEEKVLNQRQKNIIEAHEKGHGLRDFTSPIDRKDFTNSLDINELRKEEEKLKVENQNIRFVNYLSTAEEIAERMAQLKNYFGFHADDVFTKEHLQYAKEHYVKDTKLDNNMTTFFKAVTPETEVTFLETINKYPL